jgi:hypothetical protein
MGSNINAPNAGTTKRLVKHLQKNVGQVYTLKKLKKTLGLSKGNTAINGKMRSLANDGFLGRTKINSKSFEYTVLPSIVDCEQRKPSNPHKTKQNGKQNHSFTEALENAKNTQLNSMQNFIPNQITTQHQSDLPQLLQRIIDVDAENRLLKNILEQVALLLEQAGTIEKVE